MQLINQTPAVAEATVTTGADEDGPRIGMLTAKLTYLFDNHGRTAIDTQNPIPLFTEDQETELGLLPSDAAQRRDPAFEVVLAGAAHAPEGRPAEQVVVGVQVGGLTRYLVVTGERAWIDHRTFTRPVPFARMPLTFERAFGGTAEVFVDMESAIDVRDPLNQRGRGFDAEAQAKQLAEFLEAPAGFPVIRNYQRSLPNLEHPDHRITHWDDAPRPYCWSAVPRDLGFSQIRYLELLQLQAEAGRQLAEDQAINDLMLVQLHQRAHPDWIIDLPPPRARVAMQGLRPEGTVAFELPQVRVHADYILGERQGTRELAPHLMVLLPEQWRLYVVYRTAFTLETAADMERSFRLRLEQGWFQYPEQSNAQ